MNIKTITIKNFKKVASKYVAFFAGTLYSFIAVCLSMHVFLYVRGMEESGNMDGSTSSLLFMLTIIMFFVAVVLINFSFIQFIQARAEEYQLFVLLGIKRKDFMVMIITEYVIMGFAIVLLSALFGQTCASLIVFLIASINHLLGVAVFQGMGSTLLVTVLVYIVLLISGGIGFFIRQRSVGVIGFMEGLTRKKRETGIGKVFSGCLCGVGILLVLLSILLLVNYSVGKMLIATGIHVAGMLLVFEYGGEALLNLVRRPKRIYYKFLLEWNELTFQWKQNGKIFFAIYAINFITVFIIGGFTISFLFDMQKDHTEEYPYGLVYYGNDGLEPKGGSQLELLDKLDVSVIEARYHDEQMMGISEQDYYAITGRYLHLKEGAVYFLEQKAPEPFKPMDPKSIEIVFPDGSQVFQVTDSDWGMLFGSLPDKTGKNIMIWNDQEFKRLSRGQEVKTLVLSDYRLTGLETERDIAREWSGGDEKIFFRSLIVESKRAVNMLLLCLLGALSIIMILVCEGIIYVRYLLNYKTLRQDMRLLDALGITPERKNRLLRTEFIHVMFIPVFYCSMDCVH